MKEFVMVNLNTPTRRLLSVTLLCSLLMLSGCSQTNDSDAEVVVSDFVAVGYAPIAAQQGNSDDLKMLNAIKASKLDAYKELAEQVYGIMLTSENSVQSHQLKNDSLKSKVSGLVRGAKILRTYHQGDLYITELGLDITTLMLLNEYQKSEESDVIMNVETPIYY